MRGTRIHYHSENTILGRTLDFEFVTDLAVDEQADIYERIYRDQLKLPNVGRECDGHATRVYAGTLSGDYTEVVLWDVYLHRHPTQAAQRAKRDAIPTCNPDYTTEEVYDEQTHLCATN